MYNVRGCTRSSYAYDDVVVVGLIDGEVFPGLGGAIFCFFDGAAYGGLSACDDSDDEVFRYPEGRRAFGGIQDPEPAAGAGTDIEQAPAVL